MILYLFLKPGPIVGGQFATVNYTGTGQSSQLVTIPFIPHVLTWSEVVNDRQGCGGIVYFDGNVQTGNWVAGNPYQYSQSNVPNATTYGYIPQLFYSNPDAVDVAQLAQITACSGSSNYQGESFELTLQS